MWTDFKDEMKKAINAMQQGFRKAMYFNDGKLHDLVTYVWSMQIVTINHFVIAVQRHYKPFFFILKV